MASASKIQLDPSNHPVFAQPDLHPSSAQKASSLLQRNHDDYHIFFNADGFHDHIAHHLLTLYALGADTTQLQAHFDNNANYQRPSNKPDRKIVEAMKDPAQFSQYLGKQQHYNDFMAFFQSEMDSKGYQAVLNEYLFADDDPRAEDLLVRMYAGFLHPIIHLGFGVEFEQPAIIAESLAQAAVHANWIGQLLLPTAAAEEANENEAAAETGASESRKPLTQILHEIHANPHLLAAPRWSDGNKLRGMLSRARDPILAAISQYRVLPSDDLSFKTAEMIHAACLFTSGAQHPPKRIKFDFYMMHCVNASLFFSAFTRQAWIAEGVKRRLLEWKGRVDLAMYISRRSPKILVDEIAGYAPKRPGDGDGELVARVLGVMDDGHASKLVRAVLHAREVCRAWEDRVEGEGFVIRGEMWDRLAHMVVDSVEDEDGERWVRSAGFEEAWREYRDRVVAVL